METRMIYETVGDPLTGGLTEMKVAVGSRTQFVPVKPKFCPECGKRIKKCDSDSKQ
jgi:rRNA maturation endonuclease Nob1